MSNDTFRLVTRSDFDGLVCAVLLKEVGLIDDITFVHPKDMQDGKIEVTGRDITTNLPYAPGVHLCFDHHVSETLRHPDGAPNQIIDPDARSAARVVYDHYGGSSRFPAAWTEMIDAVDKADSAQFTADEILHPTGWVLLNFLMDARTGLGRFHQFRISNYALMMDLTERCRTHSIEEIIALPDVQERVQLYREHEAHATQQITRCATVRGDLVVIDLRDETTIYAVNRFVVYALFPDATLSIHVMWGLRQQNTVFAIGKSILNPTSPINVGELCLGLGGGGHRNAGTCQVPNDESGKRLAEVISRIEAASTGQPIATSHGTTAYAPVE